jgi:hypothetical protein
VKFRIINMWAKYFLALCPSPGMEFFNDLWDDDSDEAYAIE